MARIECLIDDNPREKWIEELNKLDGIVIHESEGYIEDTVEGWEYRCLPEQLAQYYEFPYEEGDIVVDMQTTDLYLLIYYPALDSRSPEFKSGWLMETGNTYIAMNITTIRQGDDCIYIPNKARYQLANDSERISDNAKEYQKLIKEGKHSDFYKKFLKDNNFDILYTRFL